MLAPRAARLARVPIYEGGNIGRDNPSGARFQAADFGPNGFAEGLSSLAHALSGASQEAEDISVIHDRAAVKEATNAINGHYLEIAHTGPNAYFAKQGKDALETRPMVEKSLDTLIQQTAGRLQNDRQKQMFSEAMTPQRQSWGANIADYAQKETVAYEANESEARITMSGELARATFITDPEQGEQHLNTALSEIATVGRLKGWGPDAIKEAQLKTASGTYRDVGTRLAYEGGESGPALAEAFVDAHRGSMSGDDAEAVLGHARVQTNAIEAERRRAEADAKREASEAKHEAKDAAQSVYRNIQDGVHVEPKDLADAMEKARFAGDDALVEGLRQGGLKNALTYEWADASPQELQERVNTLSADIVKKGGKASADTIVERDHLQTLLNASNAKLKNDPLSWGAEHLGINPGTLNTNDPASINNRISAAMSIARRTGARPQVLTNEEAAQYGPLVQSGTVKQKKELALTLAKFGPMSLNAAQQVTNDSGFHNLVGLAGHRNRAVAASRVNQVVEGQELLKTAPFAKLVDDTQAKRMTGDYIGQSLQFHPQVLQGVYSNAQAILASEANERGYRDWPAASKRWYAAVNSALGAYTAGGKQHGGLHSFNDGVTILPEDMTAEDFEMKVSRAQGPSIKKAQNGSPTYSDGSFATATEIKKMQWVPIRDGVYRLQSRGGFLHTPKGGFYEVDVRKLP